MYQQQRRGVGLCCAILAADFAAMVRLAPEIGSRERCHSPSSKLNRKSVNAAGRDLQSDQIL